jgi:hypothetical protein
VRSRASEYIVLKPMINVLYYNSVKQLLCSSGARGGCFHVCPPHPNASLIPMPM